MSAATDLGRLQLGQQVKVTGSFGAAGFRALRVRCKPNSGKVVWEGSLEALKPAERTLCLFGRRVELPTGAVVKDLLRDTIQLEELAVGDMVRLKGCWDEQRGFLARSVKRKQVFGFAVEEIQGRVAALRPERSEIEVAGVRIQLLDSTVIET